MDAALAFAGSVSVVEIYDEMVVPAGVVAGRVFDLTWGIIEIQSLLVSIIWCLCIYL